MSEDFKKIERLSKDQYYINISEEIYQRSTCLRRKFGAVLVKNEEIIATGYNGAPRGVYSCVDKGYCWRDKNNIAHGTQYEKCFAVHAETNAIISAARKDMIDATMYCAGENFDKSSCTSGSCVFCCRLILNSGITKLVFRDEKGILRIEYPQRAWKTENFVITGLYG